MWANREDVTCESEFCEPPDENWDFPRCLGELGFSYTDDLGAYSFSLAQVSHHLSKSGLRHTALLLCHGFHRIEDVGAGVSVASGPVIVGISRRIEQSQGGGVPKVAQLSERRADLCLCFGWQHAMQPTIFSEIPGYSVPVRMRPTPSRNCSLSVARRTMTFVQAKCSSASSSGSDFFYHYDGLGSVVGLTDPAGKLLGRYAYDAWGQADLSAPRPQLGTKNKFRFTGEALDPGTRLYYLRARYYDPSIGRFISKEPFAGSFQFTSVHLSRYSYAASNPVRNIDPSGLFWGELFDVASYAVVGGTAALALSEQHTSRI